ncbi:AmmeMemoRadiSam system protein A [Geobacter sp. SVR]|uniref:AmmeMemoRadiSam system protein A n=1 Tax=Geobacter sp. SVR TaxID=2495594 RepID=UPI00143EF679|nr:AmmeMemoRadiSam system protein A [Geobacter sp. SVR]BCS55695.1 AmmeMemoRadiSam system protein A [Geobacter sp. SVR]GCF83699.1 AmmeMemoRadiSam system protein A [Geobacter sp. SVR]
MAELLTKTEQKELLKIARDTINGFVMTGEAPPVDANSPGMCAENGCFVTIKQHGRLRGCIGNFMSDKPLFRLVQEMAISAATQDPRFYRMKPQDLENFDLEISVLSPLKKISAPEEIQVGKHGLYIVKNTYRGVLLPQVATEYGWDRETFLKHICLKAGLPENAWKKQCDIYVFTALVFAEE